MNTHTEAHANYPANGKPFANISKGVGISHERFIIMIEFWEVEN